MQFSQTQGERLSFSLFPLEQSYGFLGTRKKSQDMCNCDTVSTCEVWVTPPLQGTKTSVSLPQHRTSGKFYFVNSLLFTVA